MFNLCFGCGQLRLLPMNLHKSLHSSILLIKAVVGGTLMRTKTVVKPSVFKVTDSLDFVV